MIMNKWNGIGRIGKDIDLRHTQNEKPVCNFNIAVDNGYGDKKQTHWISCIAWNKTAENIAKFFGKGDLIGITGKLTTRIWEGQDGKKNYVTEVLVEEFSFFSFCGGKKLDGQAVEQMHDSDYDDSELPF